MSFIDLSVLFEPDTLSDIPIMRPHFQYSDHETGAGEMMKTYGRRLLCGYADILRGSQRDAYGRALALCAHYERR